MWSSLQEASTVVTPAIWPEGKQLVHKDEIVEALGESFAVAECGIKSAECVDVSVHAEELLTLPELVRGFLGLQSRRAPGIMTIPAEAHQLAAREAAYVHWPIIAKAMLRQTVPVAWAGTLVTGIEKPHKPLNVAASWRSIALYEAAAKGVAKAFRERMLPAVGCIVKNMQCGAQRGCPIELPSHAVRAYAQAAKKQGSSGGVLFVDGLCAYYSSERTLSRQ